jgi:uncharacterized protein (DUF2141 family)
VKLWLTNKPEKLMYKFIFAITGSLGFLLFANTCKAQIADTLLIDATNFTHEDGHAIVNLFRSGDELTGKPFKQAKGSIVNGKSVIIFVGLAQGEYAAILFQDENENGILDHRFGFRTISWVFTMDGNSPRFSGMPTFNKLKFNVNRKKFQIRNQHTMR